MFDFEMLDFFLLFFFSFLFSIFLNDSFLIQPYIIYLGGHSHGPEPSLSDSNGAEDFHHEFLSSFVGSKKVKDVIVYSYTKHINSFTANLEDEEAEEISKHPDVISIFLNKEYQTHTTHLWQFLGMENNGGVPSDSIWQKTRFGDDIIIGNIDTGVWPESKSFNDEGIGPVPSRWKGFCQNNTKTGVPCNRKLIGARYFKKGYENMYNTIIVNASARDEDGHGTHTLSTAGGNFVADANIYGLANGTAKGGLPNARVAMYKVGWKNESKVLSTDADILAAFDAAIHDGVDVISASLGTGSVNYTSNSIAIGSFHAVKRGVIVVSSAGNNGPLDSTVNNVAPWILTVGASTMDREFPAYVELGNKKHFKGQSLSQTTLPTRKLYPLISSVDAKLASADLEDARNCNAHTLDPAKVTGKIVVCLRPLNLYTISLGRNVLDAGGIGMVVVNAKSTDYNFFYTGSDIVPELHLLPATHISASDGAEVFSYINSTEFPMAYITPPTTQVGTKPAPSMAEFSSIGPNLFTPEILKPDIIAPGFGIFAAYTQSRGPGDIEPETRQPQPFNIQYGTSMACPVVASIAGLLKSLYPDWSPAMIKSALMTTASTLDNTRKTIRTSKGGKATPFNYGAGHVQPQRAMDPGLVYDLTVNDYLNFLCATDYNETQITPFSEKSYTCPKSFSLLDFNYPSITVPNLSGTATVTRTVKNVGGPGTYIVDVREPKGISVTVEPQILKFEKTGEEKTYKVTLKGKRSGVARDYVFGKLMWSDGMHYVKSPIVVKEA
ncbi:hypothetical protein HHK36_024936 [Tetracentron sinense]|uniref:Uncharacterized protein n=1 Tax=Tetracentron sinense TaxID=13715 RepID=A0A834YLS4_TETSI|nr:hypothetical protein HHK36_024936 [Tetracentron sinense]